MSKIAEFYFLINLAASTPKMEGRQLGFINGDKGETAYLNTPNPSKTVMIFELIEGKPRGGHVHQEKEEYIYVIEGQAKFYGWLPDNPDEVECIELKKADWMMIRPGLAHIYVAAPHALILEQSPQAFNKDHTSVIQIPQTIGV